MMPNTVHNVAQCELVSLITISVNRTQQDRPTGSALSRQRKKVDSPRMKKSFSIGRHAAQMIFPEMTITAMTVSMFLLTQLVELVISLSSTVSMTN
jgi:hypothetical protein